MRKFLSNALAIILILLGTISMIVLIQLTNAQEVRAEVNEWGNDENEWDDGTYYYNVETAYFKFAKDGSLIKVRAGSDYDVSITETLRIGDDLEVKDTFKVKYTSDEAKRKFEKILKTEKEVMGEYYSKDQTLFGMMCLEVGERITCDSEGGVGFGDNFVGDVDYTDYINTLPDKWLSMQLNNYYLPPVESLPFYEDVQNMLDEKEELMEKMLEEKEALGI